MAPTEKLRSAQRTLLVLYWLFVVISSSSIALAMLTTTDTRWMQWHLSRLGEGVELPAAIFNFSLCVIGCVVFLLIMQLVRTVRIQQPTARTWPLSTIASVLLLQHIGLATFPYDRFGHIHDFFGYGLFIVASGMLFFSRFIAPFCGRNIHRYGLLIATFAAIPMILYQFFGVGTLLVMELYGIVCMYIWFWLMLRTVTREHST